MGIGKKTKTVSWKIWQG